MHWIKIIFNLKPILKLTKWQPKLFEILIMLVYLILFWTHFKISNILIFRLCCNVVSFMFKLISNRSGLDLSRCYDCDHYYIMTTFFPRVTWGLGNRYAVICSGDITKPRHNNNTNNWARVMFMTVVSYCCCCCSFRRCFPFSVAFILFACVWVCLKQMQICAAMRFASV